MSVEIRTATADHAEHAAQLLHATAPPYFDHLYGYDAAFRARLMAQQWRAGEGLLSHRHAMAAYAADGGLLGLELGFDRAAEVAAFTATDEILRAHATAAQRRKIAKAARELVHVTPITRQGEYCVQGLAVADSLQSNGLGRRLLEGAFRRAAAAGYSSVCLDVMQDNPAVGFYRHLGMRLVCETRLPELMARHQFPVVYRMLRDL